MRIQQIIADTLERRRARLNLDLGKQGKPATALDDGTGVHNIVFYERGAGTAFWTGITGGAFGSDLPDKIRNAYRFLSYHYEPGAQVFLFGFSRGSFTARSLAGLIHAAGLLRAYNCTPENEDRAWKYYRTQPNARLPGIWSGLQPLMHSSFEISCIGVFDTVGALGIPLAWATLLNRDRFQFHSVELSSLSRLNLQALAIDERRQQFAASVWRRPRFKQYRSVTEQVWFSGVHSDIGGGYIPEVRRPIDHPQALDDITLDWMLKRLRVAYPDFPADPGSWTETKEAWATAGQHDSRGLLYRLTGQRTLRVIGNNPIESKFPSDALGCYDRHARPENEMVHISALQRLGRPVLMGGDAIQYAPPNLLDVLPLIRATYHGSEAGLPEEAQIKVVDWNGETFDAGNADHRTAVLALLDTAAARLS